MKTSMYKSTLHTAIVWNRTVKVEDIEGDMEIKADIDFMQFHELFFTSNSSLEDSTN